MRDDAPLGRPVRFLLLAWMVALAACSSDATSPTGPGSDDPTQDAEPYDHRQLPGASAEDLLRADSYDSLVVQIQYVEGFRPTDQGVANLREFLTARINKPRGISIVLEAIDIQTQSSYTADDVATLEEQHRTAYTEGSTLALYFILMDGEFADDANVLGFAYWNTSMAIFQEKIENNTGGALQPSQSTVEGIVMNHEVGHNLGLVNNGTPMQTDHHDEEHGKHCDNTDCLMYYQVRRLDFIQNMTGDGPLLGADCIDDLQANGGK